MKNKIYYVMDTMCGWCYGFSDVITKIHEKHKDKYDFEIIPGGMWMGDMEAQSFPTVILEKDNIRTIIAQGYSNFEELDKILLEG
ncbi:hypothetical protein G9F72_011440 [Clostridium estertheticum]|uniref:hypothetical protein n=1 Tax=Clostridium estertheticum TaxID=238834 RepID=UPI0013E98422|nr:hypothetical protein [Clostridium estertheticum]MBZ9686939.1 hypothetical protein [Clostridium estertheticum]